MLTTILALCALADPGATSTETVLADALTGAMGALRDREQPPYYIAASVLDWERVDLSASDGTIASDDVGTGRALDIDLRVGDPALDSTHPLRGFSELDNDDRGTVLAPLDDAGLGRIVWRELDARYREAAERIVVVRANRNVKVEEETGGADFEPRTPVVDRQPIRPMPVVDPAWRERIAQASRALAASEAIDAHQVGLTVVHETRALVDTEGTRISGDRIHARLWLQASATLPDGDEVSVFEAQDVHDPASLDVDALLTTWTAFATERMAGLAAAPRGEPYSGPVLLEGRATGVFFHEVLGHRVEGHRQKREDEGKTFAGNVGRAILPEFIDVIDDPSIPSMAGQDLNGFYRFDDEGVAAAPAEIVKDGVFVGFLLGRSPIDGFEHSNGHGRRSPGNPPLARMGNTIVHADRTVPRAALRKQLLAEVKAQGLDYGYIVDDIEGGFTLTGRTTPNAFNVRATASWRVYADGRPDELVRGIDLVGTPLVAFRNLVAAGDDPQVFNGTCGAESGWVPVSAVAPSVLFRTLEFQRKEKGQDRALLLPRPTAPEDGAADAGGAR